MKYTAYRKTGNFSEENFDESSLQEINFGELLDVFIEKALIWVYTDWLNFGELIQIHQTDSSKFQSFQFYGEMNG